MNEEAIRDGYNYFVSTGYNGTYDDYVALINGNENALNDTYSYFTSTGYNGGIDNFKTLMGVGSQVQEEIEVETEVPVAEKASTIVDFSRFKKKEDTESVSENGSSVSPKDPYEEQLTSFLKVQDPEEKKKQISDIAFADEKAKQKKVLESLPTKDKERLNLLYKKSQGDEETLLELTQYPTDISNLTQEEAKEEYAKIFKTKENEFDNLQKTKGGVVRKELTKPTINKPQSEYDPSLFKYNNDIIAAIQKGGSETKLLNYTRSIDEAKELNAQLIELEKQAESTFTSPLDRKSLTDKSLEVNKIARLRSDIVARLKIAQAIEREYTIDPEIGAQDVIDYFPDIVDDVVDREFLAGKGSVVGAVEKNVVKQANSGLDQYGFTFEGTDAYGDGMIVRSANGKSVYINLNYDATSQEAYDNSEKLQTFLNTNRRESEIQYLKDATLTKGQRGVLRKEKKLLKKEDVDKELKTFQDRTKVFNNKLKVLLKEEAEFENKADNFLKRFKSQGQTTELLKERDLLMEEEKALRLKRKDLNEEGDLFENEGKDLDRMAGEYYRADADNGTFLGTTASHIKEGVGSIVADAVYLGITIPYLVDKGINFVGGGNFHILPTNMIVDNYSEKFKDKAEEMGFADPSSMSEDDIEKVNDALRENALQTRLYGEEEDANPFSQYTNAELSGRQGGILNDIRKGVRNAYGEMSSRGYDEEFTKTFWGQVWAGTMSSIPAILTMVGSAPAAAVKEGTKELAKKGIKETFKKGTRAVTGAINPKRQWAMIMQTQDMLNQEMNANPELRNVPEEEKFVLGAILGLTTGVLEDVGLRNMINNKGFVNGLILKGLGKSGATSSAKTFQQIIREDVNNMVARLGLTAGAGFAAEFETGVAQEIANIGVKEVYDAVKGKDYFKDNPKTAADFINQTLYAGVSEGAGSLILGLPNILSSLKRSKNFTEVNDATWNLFTNTKDNPKFLSMQKLRLESQVKAGDMTASEARNVFKEYQDIIQAFEQVPKNLKRKEQQEALGLIINRKQLEERKRDKNPLLTKQEDAAIAEIDRRLAAIGEVSEKRFKTKQDAIQKQSTGEVDADQQAADAQAVETGTPTTESQELTGEKLQDQETDAVEGVTQFTQEQVEEINALPDEETQTFTTSSLEEVPAEFRDRAELIGETKVTNKILGLPIGKTTTTQQYRYEVTGKELKDFVNSTSAQVTTQEEVETVNVFDLAMGDIGNKNVQQLESDIQIIQDEITSLKNISERNDTTEEENQIKKIEARIKEIQESPVAEEVETVTTPVAEVIEETAEVTTEETIDESLKSLFDEIVGEPTTTEDAPIKKQKTEVESVTVNRSSDRTLSTPIKRIIGQAKRAAKSIKNIAPNVKIILHESEADYRNSVPGAQDGEAGAFNSGTNTIHINLPNAAARTSMTTVGHETFHSILFNLFNNEALIQVFSINMLEGLKKASVKGSAIEKQLDAYIKQYKDTGQHNEEKLAEIFGYLAGNYETLDVKSKNILKRLIEKLAKIFNIEKYKAKFTEDDVAMVKLMNNLSAKISEGIEITEADVSNIQQALLEKEEQGGEGEVGTIRIKPQKGEVVIDTPNPTQDPRSWIRGLVETLEVADLNNQNFVTNMYDYTNAGVTDLGNGYTINLLGGRNYVPIIMDKLNKKLGDVSNLAAFNTKAQAEGFIRNATEGNANLFAPHSGTLDGSWQFQQHIFEELVNLVLDENILSNKELINAFNQGLVRTPKALESELKKYKKNLKSFNNKGYYLNKDKQRVEESPVKPTRIIEPLRKFLKKYNEEQSKKGSSLPKLKNTKNLNDFLNNPKELVKLLNIENNLSPDLRKRLNQKIAANKKFQKAIGIKNLGQFHQRIMDPLNKGVVGGEIMTFIQFDPNTFEVAQTNPNDVDHHPSFGWVVKAKIEKIYQPNKFYKSYDLTETYTKYNTNETKVSRKTDKGFVASNVTSSAGSLPKVATIKRQLGDTNKINEFVKQAREKGATDSAIKRVLESEGVTKSVIDKIFADKVRTKRPPSAAKILGKPKTKKVTANEMTLLKEKLRAIARETKNLVREINKVRRGLQVGIAEIGKGRKVELSPAIVTKITSRINKANLLTKEKTLNNEMVDEIVQYIDEQYTTLERKKENVALNKKRKTALKNIKLAKFGIKDNVLVGPLKKLLTVDAILIPDAASKKYKDLINMVGAKQKVLTLKERSKVAEDVNDILNDIYNDKVKLNEYILLFESYPNKIVNDKGNLSYSRTLSEMLKEGLITEKDMAFMKKFKKEILPPPVPQTKEEIAEQEAKEAAEKEVLIKEIKEAPITKDAINKLPTRLERDDASNLRSLLKKDVLNDLTNKDLKILQQVISNINNGWFSNVGKVFEEKLTAIINNKQDEVAVKNAKPFSILKAFKTINAAFNKIFEEKETLQSNTGQAIAFNTLYNIDQVLGNATNKTIFNNLFNPTAKASSTFESKVEAMQKKLENSRDEIFQSNKRDSNKTIISDAKIMTYLLQREFESNPDRTNEVNSAASYLKATIKKENDNLSDPSQANAKMLEKILKDYSVEGEIDNESLYESLSRAERKAIKVIDEVNKELNEIAEYTASIINGQEFNPIDNYVHLWVMPKAEESNMVVIEDEVRKIQSNNNPSAKSKTFEERTKGAKALNFNPFGATMRGGRMTLLNYYMTSPIRTANRELNMLVESFEGDAIQKREIVKGIKGAYEQVVRDVLVNGVATTSMFDETLQYLAKTGYRTMLAGLGRSVFQELPSNAINAIIYAPKEFVKGSQVVMQEDGETKVSAISNLKSTQQQRIYTDALTGVNVDVNLLKDKKGIRGEAMRSNVMNKTKQILDSKYNVAGTGRKLVESLADKLITVPDKLIIERVWWGGFTTQFKKITGKEADIKKIAKNDEQYMRENKEALEKATELADRDSFFTGATDNPFLGILAQTKRPSDSVTKKAYKNFNRFMLRFVLIEYENARTAILNLYKSRELSRVKAFQLLAATTSRMVLYTALGGVVGSTVSALIRQMFGYEVDEEEEDDEKSVTQTVAQSFVSTFVNMVIGRNFGQAFRTIASQTLIEPLNEKYLKALYNDDFDPYRDAVSFSVIPPKTQEEEYKGRDRLKILLNLTGPYSPMAKTISKSIKVFTRAEPKEEPTKERYSKEKALMFLEFAGYAGLIPFFKDVKKAATDETYKDLRIAKKKAKKDKDDKDYSPSWLREGDK